MIIDEKTVSMLKGRKIVEASIDTESYCLTIKFEDGPELEVCPTTTKAALKVELTFCP